MKTSHTLLLTLVLLYINASTEWPMHTVCKEDNLEIHYKSCDPQQDFALSIDHCSDVTTHTFNIRAAMVLRHSIKELYVNLALIVNGKTVLTYSETLCEPGHSKLIFCGKKKGAQTDNGAIRALTRFLVYTPKPQSEPHLLQTAIRYTTASFETTVKSCYNKYNNIPLNQWYIGNVFEDALQKSPSEHLYYEGPVTLGIKEIPQGDYTISAKLTNEDHATVGCADFTVKNYLEYH